MRAIFSREISVNSATIVKISKPPLLVKEEVHTPTDIILEDSVHGKIFCSVRKAWAKEVSIGDKISANMSVQERGFDDQRIFVAKNIRKLKIEKYE